MQIELMKMGQKIILKFNQNLLILFYFLLILRFYMSLVKVCKKEMSSGQCMSQFLNQIQSWLKKNSSSQIKILTSNWVSINFFLILINFIGVIA